ncbi:uncharacterized protein [Dermacentor andersoni]|uniref:uncharacterized protein n=1 Tax=Dermacentor andersoni TaxID=34620 RepID=UPI002416B950|nr:uncharacterized protein LOC126540473 [Dermacentor andersoni]
MLKYKSRTVNAGYSQFTRYKRRNILCTSALEIMRLISTAICIVVLVASTVDAHAIPEEESNLEATFDRAAKCATQDAVYVGEILREVAQTLAEDEDINSESDEYFLRALWEKTKDALKNATEKVKVTVKGAYDNAKGHITKAAEDAKKKIQDKAAEIISKLLTKVTSGYAVEDSANHGNFIKMFVGVVMRAAERFMKMGKALESIQN